MAMVDLLMGSTIPSGFLARRICAELLYAGLLNRIVAPTARRRGTLEQRFAATNPTTPIEQAGMPHRIRGFIVEQRLRYAVFRFDAVFAGAFTMPMPFFASSFSLTGGFFAPRAAAASPTLLRSASIRLITLFARGAGASSTGIGMCLSLASTSSFTAT